MTHTLRAPQARYTWTETYRHECEVRYVVNMPMREQRAMYVMSVEKRRGKEAAERLRNDVIAEWRRISGPNRPISPDEEGAHKRPGSLAALHVNTPGSGSSLGGADAGNSNPVVCVESGGGTQ